MNNVLNGQKINFMSIDVEGYDLEVLQSNDWNLYKPTFILIEILTSSLDTLNNNEITQFLKSNDYHIYAKCINTVFFRHNSETQ